MKTLLSLLLLTIPWISQAQTSDSVTVYEGKGAFQHRIIDLSNGNYREIPAKAIHPDVEVLILDNNKLTTLPDWLINLPKLRSISIRNNQLTQVNTLIFCNQLEEIYLSGNPGLNVLPDFQRCPKLLVLDVTQTGIHGLPANIRNNQSIGYFKYSK